MSDGPLPPKRPLAIFIGHSGDASEEAKSLFGLRSELDTWFKDQPRQHDGDFPFERLTVYEWEEEMSARTGGQKHIDAQIDEALVGVFVFRASVGEGTRRELDRMLNRAGPVKPHLLCCFPEAPASSYDKSARAAWDAVCDLREALEDWAAAGEHATKPLANYRDVAHLKQIVLQHLTTKDLPDLIGAEKRRRASASPEFQTAEPSDAVSSDHTTDIDFAPFIRAVRDVDGRIDFIGVGRGEMRIDVEKIYIPLRITEREQARFATPEQLETMSEASVDTDIAGMLRIAGEQDRFPVVLGEPGAGKTTALRKLLGNALDDPTALGLPTGTIPIFLRLRALAGPELPPDFATYIQREVDARLGGAFHDYGERLWARGRLLLLLDGLDEISDEQERLRAVQFIKSGLTGARARQIYTVVSSRFTGYGGDITLGYRFMTFAVRELNGNEVDDLIRLWFREVTPHTDLPLSDARARGEHLCDTLRAPDHSTQQIRVMVSNPLLLTLLCIVVMQGGEIPKRRADFYRECLHTLLIRWVAQRKQPPLLEFEVALAVLSDVAWALHTAGERDTLSPLGFIALAEAQLTAAGPDAPDAVAVFEWLVDSTGVITQYADGYYGFAHLGFQEYLTALASHGPGRIDTLADNVSDQWWEETILLACGLPTNAAFVPLATTLVTRELASPSPSLVAGDETAKLLQRCQDEAFAPAPTPWLALLESARVQHQALALQMLTHYRTAPVREATRPFVDHDDLSIKRFARRILRSDETERRPDTIDTALLLCHAADAPFCEQLAQALTSETGDGHFTVVASDHVPRKLSDTKTLLETPNAFVFASPEGWIWDHDDGRALLSALAQRNRPIYPCLLAGADTPTAPLELPSWQPLEPGRTPEQVARQLLRSQGSRGDGTDFTSRNLWIEQATGMCFLLVEGGLFQMGSESVSVDKAVDQWCRPIHPVHVSTFCLAESPVTNRQYAVFLASGTVKEPGFWRERRFSHPDQPVVGVSWHDATAFCEWLSQASGRSVFLPSEAQWERAARGSDGRTFPWGDDPPDPVRARFTQILSSGTPSPVGAYPAGAGPHGHLDLAGNVWEWCCDVFQADAYRRRANSEIVDPVVGGESDQRVLRGGSWNSPAEDLASAIRVGLPAGFRNGDVGFRVASALEC
ncbi:MAG: SUMF1/EgtB/PvdO family nonheme iron enzyme [Pseudomonadota bacterium]